MDAAFNKKRWTLTAEAFDELLANLDSNREAAGEKYEKIRRRLAHFFEYRGCAAPEDFADITINRAARKLGEGAKIYSTDPLSYFMGIARNLLQEYWEQSPKRPASLAELSETEHPREDPADSIDREASQMRLEAELECLEKCLRELDSPTRDLIVGYYMGEKTAKIVNRKRLASDLNVTPANLRLRAYRLREKLEGCIRVCAGALAGQETESLFSHS